MIDGTSEQFHCAQPLAAPLIYDCMTLMSHTHTLCAAMLCVCAMRRTHAQDQIRCSPVENHIVRLHSKKQYNFAFVMHFLDAATKFALIRSHLNDACRSYRKMCWRRNRYFICLFRFVLFVYASICRLTGHMNVCALALACTPFNYSIAPFGQSMENAERCQC